MNLIDIVQDHIWAIIPEKLDAIHQVLLEHAQGVRLDPVALEARLGKRQESSYDTTVTEDGLAIIPVRGVLAKRMNLITQFSGGTSMQILADDFRLALADDDVKAILLDIDSPGGTVDGTEALADLIFESRGQKPVVAFVNGMMASAAYWIGSAADMIIAEETATIGSIGVLQIHTDRSQADVNLGIKRSLIHAGKFKTIGNDTESLSPEARAILQEGVDSIYTIFVNTVARNMGVSSETVLADMADGRQFVGQQALAAGLIHQMGSFEYAVQTALALADAGGDSILTFTSGAWSPGKERQMVLKKKTEGAPTVESLTAEHPELVAQIRAQGAESVNTAELQETARSEEQDRILGLASVQFGEEAGTKFKAVVDSGATVAQFESFQATQPAPDKKAVTQEEMLAAIKAAGPGNPGTGDDAASGVATKDFMAQVELYKKEKSCTTGEAMKQVQALDPKAHREWIDSKQKG